MYYSELEGIASVYNVALAKLNAKETPDRELAVDVADEKLCDAILEYLKEGHHVTKTFMDMPDDYSYSEDGQPTKQDLAFDYLWSVLTTRIL